jgi:hypothetical protein
MGAIVAVDFLGVYDGAPSTSSFAGPNLARG